MVDIKHTSGGDIDLESGDVTYEFSDFQHQKDIVLSDKGHYKNAPTNGVGILQFISDNDTEEMLRSIRKEYAADGMKVNFVSMENGELITDAKYENDPR